MAFREIFDTYNWHEVRESIEATTAAEVEAALHRRSRTMEDFRALISPAALPYLEQMAAESAALTRQRFGRTVQMYIPLYLSNECTNICTYCGFSLHNRIPRTTLTDEQILREAEILRSHGFGHVLLVTGEASNIVDVDYFARALGLLRPYFPHISMEVQPLDREDYERLIPLGLHAVLVYQETYHRERYKAHHPKGRKSNFAYRLDTPDRLGQAGVHKIGLGVLLGLEDWRTDSFFTALHLCYLERTYWKTRYSISFPRLRPAEGLAAPVAVMSDRELVQLVCAYRLLSPEVELSISTRESQRFRNNIFRIGATAMSAGSRTDPGGYASELHALEQFEISDERTPEQVAAMITSQGYDVIWKDWEPVLG